jgi:hypothetical protein
MNTDNLGQDGKRVSEAKEEALRKVNMEDLNKDAT